MLYTEISLFVLRSTQNTWVHSEQNTEFLNVKAGGTESKS